MEVSDIYDAIKHNDLVTVENYLKSLTNITQATTKKVDSFLFWAIRCRKLDMIKLIITYHGSPENYTGWALALAKEFGSIEIREYLLNISILPKNC